MCFCQFYVNYIRSFPEASEDNFIVEAHFKLINFYIGIVTLLLKDIQEILEGEFEPHWMPIVEEILTFKNHFVLIIS